MNYFVLSVNKIDREKKFLGKFEDIICVFISHTM